jgi:hypothetical protein
VLFVSENRSNARRENPYSLNPVNRGKNFGVFWSFGENSMSIYRDGRQFSNRQEEVHKRVGLKIK